MNETALVRREDKLASVLDLFNRPSVQKQLSIAATQHLPAEKVVRVMQSALRNSPALLDATPQSLLACLMASATLGLAIEPVLGQAYLVPFKNKHTGQVEAQFIVGYRGYITLARRTGEVETVQGSLVHPTDVFEMERGTSPRLRHVPSESPSKQYNSLDGWRGAYCVVHYKSERASFDYMPMPEILYIRDTFSKAKDADAWRKSSGQMAVKTVLRRHLKLVPMSTEIARAVAIDEAADAGNATALWDFSEIPEIGSMPAAQIDAGQDRRPDRADFERAREEAIKSGMVDAKLFDEFTYAVAANSNAHVDDLKREAAGDMQTFFRNFHSWAQSRRKEKPAASTPAARPPGTKPLSDLNKMKWESWTENWKPMRSGSDKTGRKTGFGLFVWSNLDVFRRSPPWVQDRARAKWISLYADAPFPLDEPLTETPPKAAQSTIDEKTVKGSPKPAKVEPAKNGAAPGRVYSESECVDMLEEIARLRDANPDGFQAVRERLGLPDEIDKYQPRDMETFLREYESEGMQS